MSFDSPSPDPLGRLADGYWAESRRPLVSLVFVAPLLATYEAGVLLLGPDALRNGADVWLRKFLEWIGFGQYFLLPGLVVCILLGWHHLTGQPWRFRTKTLYAMAGECLVLAIVLQAILRLQGVLMQTVAGPVLLQIGPAGKFIGFLGAGVYEELLFRLMLLGPVILGLQAMGLGRTAAFALAVVVTSVVFSGAHYVGAYGDAFHWASFLFRLAAGVFFSLLFVYRGFGIAACTHALYDILVGIF